MLAAMRARCDEGDWDFIDGIAHGPRQWVLCLGRFEDRAPYVSDYTAERIYYKSTGTRADATASANTLTIRDRIVSANSSSRKL